MEKENIIEILEDFIDFLKEKEEDDTKESNTEEVEVIVPEESDDFNKVIDKISKGE